MTKPQTALSRVIWWWLRPGSPPRKLFLSRRWNYKRHFLGPEYWQLYKKISQSKSKEEFIGLTVATFVIGLERLLRTFNLLLVIGSERSKWIQIHQNGDMFPEGWTLATWLHVQNSRNSVTRQFVKYGSPVLSFSVYRSRNGLTIFLSQPDFFWNIVQRRSK